ncbi:hypothetical protein Mgra_00007763 [Meloidogyne graminicola]|uniref:Uncharacterized protein n=1 Tax=Meloidogyne graminicola TaxID=189291 RepID=A0A8S9ZHW7_9BILA|nr:hypothetical protein Mgra_00007763 [Meloidogyne graminicola]
MDLIIFSFLSISFIFLQTPSSLTKKTTNTLSEQGNVDCRDKRTLFLKIHLFRIYNSYIKFGL